jgi:glutamyl-tRNA reductase
MALSHLVALNRKVADASKATLLPDACAVNTCLREVRIAALSPEEQPAPMEARAAGYELHAGADAYRFLLQLACGLESEIAGETEILGQIKQAWRDHESAQAAGSRALRPWMQRLLQDAKELRTEFVVGLGSATYGSLVRRLLGGTLQGPTLLLGAGQLAETILPFLDSGQVLLWNRSRERAAALLARQRDAQAARVVLLDGTREAEADAWRRARDVVICVPADPVRDAQRVQWWRGGRQEGRLLHLGIDSAAGTAWEQVPGLATLKDLFGLRDTQATQRDALLARARKACADKAQLARLDDADGSRAGNSNHGWEDLAVFQAFGY